MAYIDPRFSELGKVLTKVAVEDSRMVLCSLHSGAPWGNEYWRTPFEKVTLTSTRPPNDVFYVPLGRKMPIGKPEWENLLSIMDGSLASVHYAVFQVTSSVICLYELMSVSIADLTHFMG